jgi:hypothetical protein
MDARTRYRRRLRLQAALTRVLLVLAGNAEAGIPADRTTALMMVQVMKQFLAFVREAGIRSAEVQAMLGEPADLERFVKLIRDRKKETHARKRRG